MTLKSRLLMIVFAAGLVLQGPLPAATAANMGSCTASRPSNDQVCNTTTCGDNFASSCGNSLGQSIGTTGVIIVATSAVVGVTVGLYFLLRTHHKHKKRDKDDDDDSRLPDGTELLPSRASAGPALEHSL
jgi:hypothetical protein